LSAVRETRPPLLEDQPAREVRRQQASKKKKKDAAKKRQIHKAKEREALMKRRRQQSLEGLPLKESPSEMVSGEDDDDDSDGDDDALSRYDVATRLADLPDVRPYLESVRGSSSQVSGLVPVTVVEEEETEERAGEEAAPSMGGVTPSRTLQEGSTVPPPQV
jgi:hypothetical protein